MDPSNATRKIIHPAYLCYPKLETFFGMPTGTKWCNQTFPLRIQTLGTTAFLYGARFGAWIIDWLRFLRICQEQFRFSIFQPYE